MRQTAPLTETANGTLNGSGNGAVFLGPGFGQVWNPSLASISASGGIPTSGTPANPPTCYVSVGSNESGAVQLDSTYQVTGAATDAVNGQVLNPGQYVFAIFVNCIPNATITMTISGTFTFAG